MTDKNFHTFIDFGNCTIRAISFNKETEKVENQLELKTKNNPADDDELIELVELDALIVIDESPDVLPTTALPPNVKLPVETALPLKVNEPVIAGLCNLI